MHYAKKIEESRGEVEVRLGEKADAAGYKKKGVEIDAYSGGSIVPNGHLDAHKRCLMANGSLAIFHVSRERAGACPSEISFSRECQSRRGQDQLARPYRRFIVRSFL